MSSHAGEPAEIDIHLLGPIEVLRAGEPVDLPGGRALSLIALLALRVGEAIPAEHLIDELWGGEAPATARTLLQGFVSNLRKVLGAEVIETTGNGYRLAVAHEAVDANRFLRIMQQARADGGTERVSGLEDALGLWRGPALSNVMYEPFAQRAITALEDQRLGAREDLAHARLDAGGHAQVVADLEELVGEHPFRERSWELLVLALYRSGRQAEALEAWRRARETLVGELGLEPGAGLRSLEQRVLRHDPSLDAPATVTSASHDGGLAWIRRERRTVTAVFIEVAPDEPNADPELTAPRLAAVQARVEEAVTALGGSTERSPGGRVVGWFGLSSVHEDDPLRALRAAIRARNLVADSDDAVQIRVGVETGVAVTDGTSASGSSVTTAARLLDRASRSEILIGPTVARLVHGTAVVGRADDERDGARPLLQVPESASLLPRDLRAPMVGRQRELTRLRTTFSATARRGLATRTSVVGEAGLGKSRLARAFHDSIAGAATLGMARCAAETGGSLRTLEELLGPLHGERGARPATASPQELFVTVRTSLEEAARGGPVVWTVDDCHWADETLLDLLEYLTDNVEAPVMLLCVARPELLDSRPEWRDSGARTTVLQLEPLDADFIAQIVADRVATELPPEQADRITKLAQGNPLFAEQFAAAWEHDDFDRVPASLAGLLASRIDRLGPAERDLLRSASVIGRETTEQILGALVPDEARGFLRQHLATLLRARLLERTGETITFGHDLIRDAAYRSVTRGDRAIMHQRAAEWLEQHGDGRGLDLDAAVGHHLEQSVLNRRLIDMADEATDKIATRAGERLGAAGAAAFDQMDLPAAEDLLRRARALLPKNHPVHVKTTQRLAETSLPMGHHAQAQQLLAELAERPDVDDGARWSAQLERARSLTLTGPGADGLDEALDVAEQALAHFDRSGDDAGRAQALFLAGWVALLRGGPVDAEAAARSAIEHADRAGAVREESAARWLALDALIAGPTPVAECLEQSVPLARLRGAEHPIAMLGRARLLAMAMAFEEAEDLTRTARRLIVERLRVRRLVMFAEQTTAEIHALAGRVPFAARSYRKALVRTRADGEQGRTAELAADLALLLADQERHPEARKLAAESSAAAPDGHTAVQALSRAAAARATVIESPDTALTLAREAAEIVPAEMLNLAASMTVQLAVVEQAVGRRVEARSHREEAIELYRQKGNASAAALVESSHLG